MGECGSERFLFLLDIFIFKITLKLFIKCKDVTTPIFNQETHGDVAGLMTEIKKSSSL